MSPASERQGVLGNCAHKWLAGKGSRFQFVVGLDCERKGSQLCSASGSSQVGNGDLFGVCYLGAQSSCERKGSQLCSVSVQARTAMLTCLVCAT